MGVVDLRKRSIWMHNRLSAGLSDKNFAKLKKIFYASAIVRQHASTRAIATCAAAMKCFAHCTTIEAMRLSRGALQRGSRSASAQARNDARGTIAQRRARCCARSVNAV